MLSEVALDAGRRGLGIKKREGGIFAYRRSDGTREGGVYRNENGTGGNAI